jgi:hypothetical protein
MFDVETLGVESNSVVLSMACIYFDPTKNPTYKELKASAFFVKLNAEDQVTRLNRKIDKSTVTWWGKQCQFARNKSLLPSSDDVSAEEAIASLRSWASIKNDKKSYVWARGNLDEIILRSLEYQVTGDRNDTVFTYNRWRDVRTAIDFLTGNHNGYCEIDHPEFNFDIDVIKHDPIDDCASDIMMLLYGKPKRLDNPTNS